MGPKRGLAHLQDSEEAFTRLRPALLSNLAQSDDAL